MLLSQERSFYGEQKILTYMLLNYSEEQPISKLAEWRENLFFLPADELASKPCINLIRIRSLSYTLKLA